MIVIELCYASLIYLKDGIIHWQIKNVDKGIHQHVI